MRNDKLKQIIVIAETDPAVFEQRMNEELCKLKDPEIKLYEGNSFRAVITYTVYRNTPESILELFEMTSGENGMCYACPYFAKPTDKRMKWGRCELLDEKKKMTSRACEHYYIHKHNVLEAAKGQFLESPFKAE